MQLHAFTEKEGLVDEPTMASELPICQRTLINWRQNGFVPFYKIGRRILYRRSDVYRVFDERYRKGAV